MIITTRRVMPGDAALFAKVADDVFDAPVVAARLKTYLAECSNRMIVAIKDGEIVGQVAAVVHHHPDKPTELYIDEVGVTPALRRQGVAHRMMSEMLAWGQELGCEEWWVGTETGNTAAAGLYQRFGGIGETFLIYQIDL